MRALWHAPNLMGARALHVVPVNGETYSLEILNKKGKSCKVQGLGLTNKERDFFGWDGGADGSSGGLLTCT